MRSGCRWVVRINVLRLMIAVSLACTGLSVTSQVQQIELWESPLYLGHPLVGRIWSSEEAEFVELAELGIAIEGASYLLLGEKHDNPDHHALQLATLERFIELGRISVVAFEMMDSDAQNRLNSIQQQGLTTLDELKAYLVWDEEGWDWNFYGPLIMMVYRAEIPMAAANITDATVGRVYGEATSPEIARILDEATMAQLNVDIDESHCGLLPESQFPAMVRVQQTRDFTMAGSMPNPAAGKLTVLIAGNYHVRQDLGVPNYLLAKDAQLESDDILALSFMEVEPGEEDPEAYLQKFKSQPAFDYIWFTPAISNEDYCASLQ